MIILLVLFAEFLSLCISFPMMNRMNISQEKSQNPVEIHIYIKYKMFEHIQTTFLSVYLYSFCHNYVQAARGDGMMTGLCETEVLYLFLSVQKTAGWRSLSSLPICWISFLHDPRSWELLQPLPPQRCSHIKHEDGEHFLTLTFYICVEHKPSITPRSKS